MLQTPHFTLEYGSADAEKLMAQFSQGGNDVLLSLRNHVTQPDQRKKARAWGIVEAAKMVGVTDPTFRKLIEKYPDIPGVITEEGEQGSRAKKYTLEAINALRDYAKTRYKRPEGSHALTIAVSNLKGGVGKTQTAVDLGKKIAIEGLRVLLLDFDAQGTATLLSSGLIPDLELSYDDTITNALLKNPHKIKDVIIPTHYQGLDIIPANLAIQDCDLILPLQAADPLNSEWKELGHAYSRLKNALDLVKSNYDVILIDCGPNLGALTLNSIIACDGMIIPLPPSMGDYSSFITFCSTLRSLFRINHKNLEYLRILITRHTGNTKPQANKKNGQGVEGEIKRNNGSKEARDMEAVIRQQFGRYVLANYMCETIEVSKSASEIGTIYDVVKPRGSKEAYRRALQHLNDLNSEIISQFKEIWDYHALNVSTKEKVHV